VGRHWASAQPHLLATEPHGLVFPRESGAARPIGATLKEEALRRSKRCKRADRAQRLRFGFRFL